MRPGYALYNHRFARFSARAAATTPAEVAHWIAGRTSVLLTVIVFAVALSAQAQESVEEVALPPWSEPTLPSSEPAPSTQAAQLPPAAEPSSSTATAPVASSPEQLPSASEPLPSSEEAFPSTTDPWSSAQNLTTAQTTVIGSPAAGGPYGGFSTKNIAVGDGPPTGEPRRFHYSFMFTVRGVWDDNIFLSHDHKTSDYYFAIE